MRKYKTIRNFLFHRVNPQRDRLWDPMDIRLFEKCIKYITNRYEVVLFEDLALSKDLFSADRCAAIMFDDGYKDNIQYAAPILSNYKCKASYYVVTDCIDDNEPTWTHTLEYLFQFTNYSEINLDFDFLPVDFRVKKLKEQEQRIAFVRKLKPFLKTIAHDRRQLVLRKVSETYSDVELPKLMMNWNDLRELKNDGNYIGSHTVTHSMLGTISDECEISNELVLSGEKIRKELGYFPVSISYPVGSYSDLTKTLSKEAGYKIGLAVKQNIYRPDKDDIFEVSRIELYNEAWWKTKLRISNRLEEIKSLMHYR